MFDAFAVFNILYGDSLTTLYGNALATLYGNVQQPLSYSVVGSFTVYSPEYTMKDNSANENKLQGSKQFLPIFTLFILFRESLIICA